MSRRPSHVATAVLILGFLVVGCGNGDGGTTSDGDGSGKSTTSTETKDEERSEVAPQPFNANGLLAGDANPLLPNGESGKVSVVAQAPFEKYDGGAGRLVFAYRNNTADTLQVSWTATAQVEGKLVATGSSQGGQPGHVAPGEVGMAYIYFEGNSDIPESGATYEFSPDVREADKESFSSASLAVVEANREGTTIVGSATNKTGEPVTGPISVEVYCFDGNNITGQSSDFAEESDVDADGSVHFTVGLRDQCKAYAIGASGYFS